MAAPSNSMSVAEYRALEPEGFFQQRVINLAREHGWLVYHTYDSRRSTAGFPDIVLARKGRVIFAEIKREGGRLTIDQRRWIGELAEVADNTNGFIVFVWKPSAWLEIEKVLA